MKQFLLVFALLVVHTSWSQEIFLSTLNNALYTLDLEDCSLEQVGSLPFSSTDISFHPNGNFYLLTSNGQIYEYDVLTGMNTFIHVFETNASQTYTALTVSAEGIFYAAGLAGDLWSYDLNTDTGTYHGDIGIGAEGDLTFYNGQLYMAAENDDIVQVNIDNPFNSIVVIDGNVPNRIFGIVSYAASCEELSVYALTNDNADIYEVDLDNNTLNLFCSIPIQVSGGASTFEFLGSNPVIIEAIQDNGFACGSNSGDLAITAYGGVGMLSYSLDGENYQPSQNFMDLPAQPYTVYVQDEVGCEVTVFFDPGLPLPEIVLTTNTDPSCGADNGIIAWEVNDGTPPYEVQFNGTTVTNFTQIALPGGDYTIAVADANGCSNNIDLTLTTTPAPSFTDVVVQPTTCGTNPGSITINLTGGTPPFEYAINNEPFQTSNVLDQLEAGTYTVQVRDEAGCTVDTTINIFSSEAIILDSLSVYGASCGAPNGRLEFFAMGGNGLLIYELEGVNFQTAPSFPDLPSGNYVWRVYDAIGCSISGTVNIEDTPRPSLSLVNVQSATCQNADGTLQLQATGEPPLQLQRNGQLLSELTQDNGLAAGNYTYVLFDAGGCTDTLEVAIGRRACPVYLPNIFSPNNDGVNDRFGPQGISNTGALITSFQIFDRWGGLIYRAPEFPLGDFTHFWDGQRAGQPVSAGVYLYQLTVQEIDGSVQVVSGDVMVAW